MGSENRGDGLVLIQILPGDAIHVIDGDFFHRLDVVVERVPTLHREGICPGHGKAGNGILLPFGLGDFESFGGLDEVGERTVGLFLSQYRLHLIE